MLVRSAIALFIAVMSSVEVPLRIFPAREGEGGELVARDASGTERLRMKMTAAELQSLRKIALPPGRYTIEVRVAHHRTASRQIDTRTATATSFILSPQPVIRGTITDADGKPIANARIIAGETKASSGADGGFAAEVDGTWPHDVEIAAAGRGTRIVELPAAIADVDLGRIALNAAATVDVAVQRNGETGPIDVAIGIPHEDGPPRRLRKRTLRASESKVTFTDLDRGIYTILASGKEPLQRAAAQANVGSGDRRRVEIRLSPAVLRARITHGGDPLASARVELTSSASRWEASLVTDAGGEAVSRVWDRGAVDVTVRAAALHTPYPANAILQGERDLALAIDVPRRRVRGRVVDSDGTPVAGAMVSLRTTADELSPTVRVTSGANGSFEFGGVREGRQLLRVMAAGYLRPDPIAFVLSARDDEFLTEARVERGTPRRLRVLQHGGAPAVGSVVVVAANGKLRAMVQTDDRGEAAVDLPVDQRATLFVFPKEGSVAVRRIDDSAGDGLLRIDVPPARSSLRIAARSIDGTILPRISLLMRYDGELFPPDVARELARQQGASLETDDEGHITLRHIPPGVYEFWPYASESEAEALVAAASAMAAPITVNVVTGENEATVKFARRR